MNEIYLVIEKNFDYDNIEFFTDVHEAWDNYEEIKSEFDPGLGTGGVICKVTGKGSLYISQEFTSNENVEILDSFDEYNL